MTARESFLFRLMDKNLKFEAFLDSRICLDHAENANPNEESEESIVSAQQ